MSEPSDSCKFMQLFFLYLNVYDQVLIVIWHSNQTATAIIKILKQF